MNVNKGGGGYNGSVTISPGPADGGLIGGYAGFGGSFGVNLPNWWNRIMRDPGTPPWATPPPGPWYPGPPSTISLGPVSSGSNCKA